MKDQLQKLDGRLIDGCFQPCADWIAERAAVDCYSVARACTDLSALAWVCSQAPGINAAVRAGDAAPAFGRMVLVFIGLASIMVLRTVFQRSGSNGCANPLRSGMQVHRLVSLFGLGALILKILIEAGALEGWAILPVGICSTAATYFASCSIKPPQRRTSPAEGRWKLAKLS